MYFNFRKAAKQFTEQRNLRSYQTNNWKLQRNSGKTEERINELNSQISALVKLRDTGLVVVDKEKTTKLKIEKRAKGKKNYCSSGM